VPSTDHLVAFVLTAVALIVIPGPSVLFVISRSLVLGAPAGLATVFGNAVGGFVQVLAVAFGLGAIVERSIAVFTIIKLVGAAYLVYLGVRAIRHRRSLAEALATPVEAKTRRQILLDGFVVGIANPKTIIIFTAILPQFVDRSAGHVTAQLLVLGALFYAIAVVSDSAWALLAGTARARLIRSPRRLEVIGGTGGLVMIGLGASLAFAGRKD
jgi:threonine/homoserine/homoserine lactone efflux protein